MLLIFSAVTCEDFMNFDYIKTMNVIMKVCFLMGGYILQLDTSKTCVSFRADRWYPVANITIQYKMRVYDYYEPGKLEIFYTIPTLIIGYLPHLFINLLI